MNIRNLALLSLYFNMFFQKKIFVTIYVMCVIVMFLNYGFFLFSHMQSRLSEISKSVIRTDYKSSRNR